MDLGPIDLAENRRRMRDGELYYSFTHDLTRERAKCNAACSRFNATIERTRRMTVEMIKDLIQDDTPLPAPHDDPDADMLLLQHFPWVEAPIRMDYGYNVKLGRNVFVNFNSTWIDTCPISVGDRTLIGPNCCFYSGTHPIDPRVRNGTHGPELGKPITIGEDCWFGGSCIVLPGVTIGRGVTVGAGSVVTKDVPDNVCVAGNPARIIKHIPVSGEEDPKESA